MKTNYLLTIVVLFAQIQAFSNMTNPIYSTLALQTLVKKKNTTTTI